MGTATKLPARKRRINARLLRPPALRQGDTIALVAPASPPLHPDVIYRAVTSLSTRGFKVTVSAAAKKRLGFIAGSDKSRLADLNRSIRSRSIKALLCLRGGYGSARIVSEIDFAALRSAPKILVGCSDITTLHCAALQRASMVTFHGPMLQSLVDADCPDFTWNSLLATLQGAPEALGSICKGYPLRNEIYSLQRGRVTAPLVGGNLAVLCSLLGTPYFPDLSGKILFFEDIGEMPFRIARCLTQLTLTGVLDSVAGFAIGVFKDCEYRPPKPGDFIEYKQTLRDVFADRLKPFGKPIVIGLPFGHLPHNATLPIGSLATLDGNKADLSLEEFGVSR
jgi:muramoyltetrapeptide carboxypeptidase